MVPRENDGGGIDFGLQAGGRLGDRHLDTAFWTPTSLNQRSDGTAAVFPHFFLDRGKPGFIVVNREGDRFVDETLSYHRMARAMYETTLSIPSFLIGDHAAVTRFGIGMVRPGRTNLSRLAKEGYVVVADSLGRLAGKLGIPGPALDRTVARFNGFALEGFDADFSRGETPYARNLGDPGHTPNPSLGVLERPPFYAVRLYPGELGTSTGLITDTHARVLDEFGAPIPGLYACGNDMDSIMGGTYPGPGVTIGPGLTFAYLAAKHAAARATAA
jgi:succinate dehydrogenase/fumarate reductase flavoprotein subunit